MTKPPDNSSSPAGGPGKPLPGAVAFVGMGISVASCVAVGVALGVVADDHLHTAPLFLLVGLLAGVGAAVASVVAQVRRYL